MYKNFNVAGFEPAGRFPGGAGLFSFILNHLYVFNTSIKLHILLRYKYLLRAKHFLNSNTLPNSLRILKYLQNISTPEITYNETRT